MRFFSPRILLLWMGEVLVLTPFVGDGCSNVLIPLSNNLRAEAWLVPWQGDPPQIVLASSTKCDDSLFRRPYPVRSAFTNLWWRLQSLAESFLSSFFHERNPGIVFLRVWDHGWFRGRGCHRSAESCLVPWKRTLCRSTSRIMTRINTSPLCQQPPTPTHIRNNALTQNQVRE